MNAPAQRVYRTVFISDVHLGTRGCRADFLAGFLREVRCDHLYLVGDILDGWRLRKSWYWDAAHDEVLRLILRHARGGARVTYIPGNHDEMFRAWLPLELEIAGIRLRAEDAHVTADGRRLLIMHGDAFDSVVRYARFLALLGDGAYHAALVANRWFNLARRRLGYPYWSLSSWLKRQVKGAVKAMDRFEAALAGTARERGFDGVVCGHIHHAEMRDLGGVLFKLPIAIRSFLSEVKERLLGDMSTKDCPTSCSTHHYAEVEAKQDVARHPNPVLPNACCRSPSVSWLWLLVLGAMALLGIIVASIYKSAEGKIFRGYYADHSLQRSPVFPYELDWT